MVARIFRDFKRSTYIDQLRRLRHVRTRNRSSPQKRILTAAQEWKSWKLESAFLGTIFAVDLLIIAGILVLLSLSHFKNGIVPVENASRTVGGVNLKLSLVWTSLPAILLQVFGLCVYAVVEAFGFRQPFVELARGAVAKKSIALDYASYFPGQREIKALQHRHWHLGFAFILSLLINVSLGPLAAHMLIDQDSGHTQETTLQQDYAFYASSDLTSSLGWDFSPVLGISSSALVYGGNYPRWTDGLHTFLNFSIQGAQPKNATTSTVTAFTDAYFAQLDCQVMSDVKDHINRIEVSDGLDNSTGTWYLNGTDHGCDWTTNLQLSEAVVTYLQTFSEVDCSSYGDSTNSGRLIIVAASNVDFNKSIPTVVTCVPTYWVTQGNLTISLNLDSRNPILGFSSNNTSELRPQWWNSFETQLNQVSSTDTTGDGGTSTDAVTGFGRIILDHARGLNGDDPLSGETLIQSSQQVFEAVYSNLVNAFMIRYTGNNHTFNGKLTFIEHKLFIDDVIAGIVVGFLLAVAILIVVIYRYTSDRAHRSILFEEPVGVLGYAGLLVNSIVSKIATSIRQMDGYRGETAGDGLVVLEKGPPVPYFMSIDIDDPRQTRIAMRMKNESGADAELAYLRSSFPPRSQEHDPRTSPNHTSSQSTDQLILPRISPNNYVAGGNSVELDKLGHN